MLPSIFSDAATRLFGHRWWFFMISVAGFVALATVLNYAPTRMQWLAAAVAGPLIFVPWGLMCLCVWFHPEQGKLQPGSQFVGKLPLWVQSVIRWYASLFLVVFILAASIVVPLFSLTMS